MVLALKKAVLTLYDLLHLLYKHYGVRKCYAFSMVYEGISGKETMSKMMDKLRNDPFKKLTEYNVTKIYDYATNMVNDLEKGTKYPFDFSSTNTLKFFLSDGSTATIRPSGTEPKIKVYFDIIDTSEELSDNKAKILEQAMRKELTGDV